LFKKGKWCFHTMTEKKWVGKESDLAVFCQQGKGNKKMSMLNKYGWKVVERGGPCNSVGMQFTRR